MWNQIIALEHDDISVLYGQDDISDVPDSDEIFRWDELNLKMCFGFLFLPLFQVMLILVELFRLIILLL